MLYKPEMFEPLTETAWDEAAVRARVEQIADDYEGAYDPETLWPAAEWDAFDARLPLTTLYAGASGVAWALARLGRDARGIAVRAVEAWRADPDFDERDEPPVRSNASLYFGETGPLAVAFVLGEESLADDLYARVRENVDAPANELMWAQVGTMIVAKSAHERTGEERWDEAWEDSARVLRERRDHEGLWDTMPFGRGLGAAHGGSTTAKVLGEPEPTAQTLAKYAVIEDGLANWPMCAGDELLGYDGEIRLQWCHGGAGVVASAAGYMDEELMLAGAETCWTAGPPGLEKGYGLCHGTAGTGYAFLATFERTGDERWLERARSFAVHALEQVDRLPPRYSLMTGSIGAALFAADCLEARATFPIVDVL
jgi:Lanthionine synthetase C-like protein